MEGGEVRRDDRPPAGAPVPGFFAGNVWVLIPLAGISIPIVAITSNSPLAWAVGAIALIAALTLAARNLIQFRHRLRLEEIAAQERLSIAERERFSAIDRLVDPERPEDLGLRRARPDDRAPDTG